MNVTSTTDIAVACYLQTLGHPITVRRQGARGVFYFSAALQNAVESYYSGEGRFKQFVGNLRNLKAQIENAPQER